MLWFMGSQREDTTERSVFKDTDGIPESSGPNLGGFGSVAPLA